MWKYELRNGRKKKMRKCVFIGILEKVKMKRSEKRVEKIRAWVNDRWNKKNVKWIKVITIKFQNEVMRMCNCEKMSKCDY